MIILLAGLKNIPAAMYESARIDGANSIRRFVSKIVGYMEKTSLLISLSKSELKRQRSFYSMLLSRPMK
jgi:ABC-type sugar transport system permease subunit